MVSVALNASFPTVIFCGPELRVLDNDAYLSMLTDKHPSLLGRPTREVWPEIWSTIGPIQDIGTLTISSHDWPDSVAALHTWDVALESGQSWLEEQRNSV